MKIADLFVKLGLKDRDFKRGIDGAEKRTNKFSSAIKKVGGLIAGVFAVGQVARFTAELVKIGGVAEGVRAAFNRIADDQTLKDLQDATKGTVAELELMKRTVMASNFNIPVEQLASLFKFATKRAQETGESVDYLVNSIVIGIGRKSPLILDNLGISAVDLRRKLEGVGHAGASVGQVAKAVGEIAEDAMRESGDIIETNAIKTERLKASWENFKLALSGSETLLNSASVALSVLRRELELLPESLQISGNALRFVFGLPFVKGSTEKALADINAQLDDFLNKGKQFKPFYDQFMLLFGSGGGSGTLPKGLNETTEEWDGLNASLDAGINLLREYINLTKDYKTEDLLTSFGIKPKVTGSEISSDFSGTFDRVNSMLPEEQEIPLPFDTAAYVANLNNIKRLNDEALDDWDNFSRQLAMVIEDNIADTIAVLAESLVQLVSGDLNLKGFFNKIISQLASFLKTIGKMFILYGIAELEFFKSFAEGPAGAVKLIAAGAALVAIGGAIGGLASRASGGISGATSGGAPQFNIKTVDRQDNELIAKVSGKDLAFILQRRGTYTANA